MKQEIEIPDGYKVTNINVRTENEAGIAFIYFEKQKPKDFAYFVDQYLSIDDISTCETIDNWLESHQIITLKQRLKTKQFSLVPWEIKIGLFKFIVLEHNLTVDDIFNFYVSYVDGSCAMVTQRLIPTLSICPTQFLDSIFDIKQNKND